MPLRRSNFRRLSVVAESRVPQASRAIVRVLRAHVRAVADDVAAGADFQQVIDSLHTPISRQLADAKEPLALAGAVEGFALAGAAMGKSAALAAAAEKIRSKALDVDMTGADELVANYLRPHVGKWIADTSEIETRTTAARLGRIYRRAQIGYQTPDGEIRGLTPREIGTLIMHDGLAEMPVRADMLARTMTIWAYGEGAVGVYEQEGVQYGEWMATLDEVTGEWDQAMHGKIVALRENFARAGETFIESSGSIVTSKFDVTHPPLHPNCRCTILPVLEGL